MTKAIKRVCVAVLILFVCLAAWLFVQRLWVSHLHAQITLDEPVLYNVKPGTPALGVLSELHTTYLASYSIDVFKIWMKLNPHLSQIKAGTYQLEDSMSLQDIFEMMIRGKEHVIAVTLVEGLTFKQWMSHLQSINGIVYDVDETVKADLLRLWHNHMGQANLAPQLEGLFLADTYYVTHSSNASDVLKRAMEAMITFLQSSWEQRQIGLPLNSPYEALTLASIIEKETAVGSERPLIAGVFINRLNNNMRLQTDPTIIYGLGDRFDGDIKRKHLKEATPYNTYVIKGLTPTPIAMAGKLAIESALQPSNTEHFYFVAKGDGTHYFSSTLAQHNAAVRKYQLKQ